MTKNMYNTNKTDISELPVLMKSLLEGETDVIANAANASALIFDQVDGINWAGFYFLKGEELVLGPFQGKPACVRLKKGRGVCQSAVEKDDTVVVADVHDFAGHIACDGASRSEIVVPVHKGGSIFAVLDIDSPTVNRFADIAGVIEATARAIEESFDL